MFGSRITINGKTCTAPPGSILSIKNGVAYIDGKKVDDGLDDNTQPVSIQIEGHGDVDAEGSVTCQNVQGGIDCGGSVRCGDVGGGISCGGSVQCGKVCEGVSAGGSVMCTAIGGL
jgi:hypothetical protein